MFTACALQVLLGVSGYHLLLQVRPKQRGQWVGLETVAAECSFARPGLVMILGRGRVTGEPWSTGVGCGSRSGRR